MPKEATTTATSSADAATGPSFEPTLDRRAQFAKRRSTKRRLKELQHDRPVLETVLSGKVSKPSTTGMKKEKSTKAIKNRMPGGVSAANHEVEEALSDDNGDIDLQHSKQKKKKRHSFLYTLLNPHSNQWQAIMFKNFISTVILIDLILFVLSTDEEFTLLSDQFYHVMEGTASSIFLAEYLGRIWTITEKKKYRDLGPIQGRLAYMQTFSAFIDLIAVLPFFMELPTGWNLPTLTYLRTLRLFRILKTEDYMKALDAVYRVIYYNRQILYVACLICILLTLFTSILLYYLRPRGKDQIDPQFESLGNTIFMSRLMLTGGGGPDTDNLPWYTKGVVLLTSVFSVAMFAIPASMLTWGFEMEAERVAKEARKRVLKRRTMSSRKDSSSQYYCSSSSSSAYSDGNTTDEEYFKLIAGLDEEEDENETPWMKEQRRKFEAADVDMDGTLTLREYMKLQQANGEDSPLQPQEFLLRLQALELQVASNATKLQRVVELLEAKK
jgi:voltage-gated potassium channel